MTHAHDEEEGPPDEGEEFVIPDDLSGLADELGDELDDERDDKVVDEVADEPVDLEVQLARADGRPATPAGGVPQLQAPGRP